MKVIANQPATYDLVGLSQSAMDALYDVLAQCGSSDPDLDRRLNALYLTGMWSAIVAVNFRRSAP